jgi:pilus assembly protein CpaE
MILYIDLSIPATQASIALGIQAEFSVADAIRETSRVDRALLESALARDPRSGLYIMPLCPDFGSGIPPLEAGSFAALLQILQGCCSAIVINYGPFSRERALLEMVQPAARFFLCCNQRFTSIKGASDLLHWFAENRLGSPEIVVHALAPGVTPSAADIRNALKISQSIDLDATWEDLAESANSAKPLALLETHYSRGLDACLARIGIAPEPEPDFLTQLRGWLRPRATVRAS